jgi:hypothetical protein
MDKHEDRPNLLEQGSELGLVVPKRESGIVHCRGGPRTAGCGRGGERRAVRTVPYGDPRLGLVLEFLRLLVYDRVHLGVQHNDDEIA